MDIPKEVTEALSPKNSSLIMDLESNQRVNATFLVQRKQVMQARNGKPYLTLTLSDRSGTLDTRVWSDAEQVAERFEAGAVVAVSGKTHRYQNRMQLVADDVVAVPDADPMPFLPHGQEDLDQLLEELKAKMATLEDPWVKKLTLDLLEDPEIANRYKITPAAKTIHHAFVGGLLTHSLQLVNIAEKVLPFYPVLDRSLVLFGCAFHDFGKIFELSVADGFNYTDEGKLVGHITIAATLVDRRIQKWPDFPNSLEWQLKHLILSHHGRLEYGSPKRPATLEAQFVHSLDDMDSKMESIEGLMRSERSSNRWTGHHRAYDQYYYKPDALLQD